MTQEKQPYAIQSLLRRARMMLEGKEYGKAIVYSEDIIRRDDTNAQAYLMHLMAILHVDSEEELKACVKPLDEYDDYHKIIAYGNEPLKDIMQGINSESRYEKACERMKTAKTEEEFTALEEEFEKLNEYKNSSRQKKICQDNFARFARLRKLKKAEVKDIIQFGSYPQGQNGEVVPIDWLVLNRQGDKILLISKYALDAKPYNEKWESVTWEKCTLRKWLNEGFLQGSFNDEERRMIGVYSAPAPKNLKYDTYPGNATKDKVFLLSIEEARKYFGSDKERECTATEHALKTGIYHYNSSGTCRWWLRSPGDDSNVAAVVIYGGVINNSGPRVSRDKFGVRPALWLILNP